MDKKDKIEKKEAEVGRLWFELSKTQAKLQTLQGDLQKAANELEELTKEK
jgi:hypothetical protein